MSASDRALMRELLCIRLREAALILLDKNTNTCKNEAVNRTLTASLPKNVNFSRTSKGRMLATCHRVNEGIGNSSAKTGMCGGTCTKRQPSRQGFEMHAGGRNIQKSLQEKGCCEEMQCPFKV